MKLAILLMAAFALNGVTPAYAKGKKIRIAYEEAKKQCLEENSSLQGKDLKKCVKKKRKKE